jgi:hypothetical protein
MSQLTDVIALLYAYQQDDIDHLKREITERYKATWLNTLAGLAQKHGCNNYPTAPRGADAKHLNSEAERDAASIAQTYARELDNFIKRLYRENPRGNRNYYYSRVDKWLVKRDTYKAWQIGLMTDSNARQYAQLRFYAENPQIAPKFRYSSIPPVSKECIKRTRKGLVTLAYVKSHLTPAHYNCPHTWVEQSPKFVGCEGLWLG